MHWTKRLLLLLKRSGNPATAGPLLLLLFLSCQVEVPTEVYENPLDRKRAEEEGIETPALFFFPDSKSVNIGESVSIEVFAMGVGDLGGAYVQIEYDKNKLSLSNASAGDFFLTGDESLFLYDDDVLTGTIDIYTVFLGPRSNSVEDTTNLSLAYLVFSTDSPGRSTLNYIENECELVDPDDNPIVINGFGEGIIHVQ